MFTIILSILAVIILGGLAIAYGYYTRTDDEDFEDILDLDDLSDFH